MNQTPEPAGESAPATQPLPFPFDALAALKAIAQQNADVARARAIHDSLKEKTADARKRLDAEEEALSKLIREIEERRRQAEREAREPKLPGVGRCPFERETGEACPICAQHALDPGAFPAVTSRDLAGLFARVRWAVPAATVDGWTPRDRGVVAEALHAAIVFGQEPDPWPPLLGRPHVAAEPAEGGRQSCVICGAQIGDTNDVAYERGWRVGVDCAGEPGAPTVTGLRILETGATAGIIESGGLKLARRVARDGAPDRRRGPRGSRRGSRQH